MAKGLLGKIMLNWTNLKSDSLKAIAYEKKVLYVIFKDGKCYYYENIPPFVYESIMKKTYSSKSKGTPSHGATFHHLVRIVYKGFRCPF